MMISKLDKIDLAIINSLIEDGRKSFRKIAREINVSTPTVESHFTKLTKIGIIKKIQPVLDFEKIHHLIVSVMYIKTDSAEANDVASNLHDIEEIINLYVTTGEYNLIAKTITSDQTQLENLRQKILKIKGIKSIYYQILTKVLKDKLNIPIEKEVELKIICELCNNSVHSLSYSVLENEIKKYFCCSSCLILYKQKQNNNNNNNKR